MSKKTDHPTENITLKTAAIDVDMIPVVNWLNSFDGVKTLFCCQGEDDPKNRNDYPYVLFTCDWDMDLVLILRTITAFGGNFSDKMTCHIDYLNERMPIRYNIIWRDRLALLEFSEFIKKTPEEINAKLKSYGKSLSERVKMNKMFGENFKWSSS